MSRSKLLSRTAAAPISWGVCEVPGWGAQLPAERVLAEMQQLGFPATELGAIGYLPSDPATLVATLAAHDLRLTGGFVALALHDPATADTARAQATEAADLLAAGGASTFVTCPVSDPDDWARIPLDGAAWVHLAAMVAEVEALCRARGLTQVIHPHIDSLVETADEINRLLEATSSRFVLETGHMSIGGFDPLLLAKTAPERIGLVHLKDIDAEIGARLFADELTLMEAVQAGVFPPLGAGDLPLAEIIATLEEAGYDGWYVIEQDVAITGPMPEPGQGPIDDVAASIAFLRSVDEALTLAGP